MSKYSAFQKIDFNIKNGMKSKAAVQLASLIRKNPNNLELRDRLAKLYFDAGFLDAAGKFWILTETNDPNIRNCVEIYEKSVNNSGNRILQEIKFSGDRSLLSDYAKNKLTELEKDSLEKTNHIPNFNVRVDENNFTPIKSNPVLEKIGCAAAIVLLLVVVVSIIVGVKTIFNWLF